MIEAEYRGYKYTVEPDGSFTYRGMFNTPCRFRTIEELHLFLDKKVDLSKEYSVIGSDSSIMPTKYNFVLEDEFEIKVDRNLRGQKWFRDLMADRKENWVPSSKGGEPNHHD